MVDLRTQLRRFIEDNFLLGASGPAFGDADSFIDLHLLDSTGFLELIANIELTYGMTVADEDIIPANLDSLDNLVAFVQRKRAR